MTDHIPASLRPAILSEHGNNDPDDGSASWAYRHATPEQRKEVDAYLDRAETNAPAPRTTPDPATL